jgi:hypothetical protein
MKRRTAASMLAAAVAGLCAGSGHGDEKASPDPARPPKHVCQGLNKCKGQGQCKHGCSGHGCAGKNDCRGHGGCAAQSAYHACAAKNDCKAIGGCSSGDKGCAGKNSCKRRGGCEVPLKIEHAALRKAAAAKRR